MKRLILAFFLLSYVHCLDHEIYESDQLNISDILNTSLNIGIRYITEYKAEKFLYDSYNNFDIDNIEQNVKFNVRNCSLFIFVPGIYSTKVRARINFRNLKRKEFPLYQKLKFFAINKYSLIMKIRKKIEIFYLI